MNKAKDNEQLKKIENDIFNIEHETTKLSEIAALINSKSWIAYVELMENNLKKISENILSINTKGFLDNKECQESIYRHMIRAEVINELIALPEQANNRMKKNNEEINKLKSFLIKFKIKKRQL